LKVVFAGTPEFALPPLQVLLDGPHEVVAVYTQPDRPAGRGRRIAASPVKQLAMAHAVPVCQPASFRHADAVEGLAALQPELMVVVAYGLILPAAVLAIPRLGCINIHASLLPRWRGAAPIQRAILAGDSETGVCLMQMEAGLDTGPVLACMKIPISPDDTGSRLHDRLARLGGQLLADNLAAIEQQRLIPRVQDEALATYARKLDKGEAQLDWRADAAELARKVRAFNAWPVAQTTLGGKQLRIWEAEAVPGNNECILPGTVTVAGRTGIDVACGTGCLRLQRLQLPGARPVSAADFINAHAVEGVRLGAD
jgi:methionyl-tRNA formyltransferase